MISVRRCFEMISTFTNSCMYAQTYGDAIEIDQEQEVARGVVDDHVGLKRQLGAYYFY